LWRSKSDDIEDITLDRAAATTAAHATTLAGTFLHIFIFE